MAPSSDNENNNNNNNNNNNRAPLSTMDPKTPTMRRSAARASASISEQLQTSRRSRAPRGASRGGNAAATMAAGQRRSTTGGSRQRRLPRRASSTQNGSGGEEEEAPVDRAAVIDTEAAARGDDGGGAYDVMSDPEVVGELNDVQRLRDGLTEKIEGVEKKVDNLDNRFATFERISGEKMASLSLMVGNVADQQSKMGRDLNAVGGTAKAAAATANEAKGVAMAANATAAATVNNSGVVGGGPGSTTAPQEGGLLSASRSGGGAFGGLFSASRGRGNNGHASGGNAGRRPLASAINVGVVAIAIVLYLGFSDQLFNLLGLILSFVFLVLLVWRVFL
eukprot:CAMPEP_0181051352 /NCGR_PEP_ID=MMETSP1070-20121207/17005_1 /TAXON_ID=265543 /ORGANISM="Minutocellus polymorphus, Strain NH13" /LENGTH=335 /DNA_ID=CAMNT_0023130361 /DNA_START=145 /DNA_END=1152 /DNA_ORIENTATION=+